MTSYAQQTQATIVDWKARLSQTDINWKELKELASDWRTCSVGQLSSLLKRREDEGVPKDKKLLNIGKKFTEAIDEKDTIVALIWLERAQKRELKVLEKTAKKFEEKLEEIKTEIKNLTPSVINS